jgi:hypothetical protein
MRYEILGPFFVGLGLFMPIMVGYYMTNLWMGLFMFAGFCFGLLAAACVARIK